EEIAEPVVEEASKSAADETAAEPVAAVAEEPAAELDPIPEFLQAPHDTDSDDQPSKRPGFSKLFDNLVGLTGFYGHGYKVDGEAGEPEQVGDPAPEGPLAEAPVEEPPAIGEEPVAEEPVAEEPVAEEVAAEEPTADLPPVDEPATGDSVVIFEEPVAEP